MHWRLPRAWQLALASHILAALLLPAADTFAVLGWGFGSSEFASEVSVTGLVFDDLDRDGEFDRDEPGLPGIVVSNGVDVFTTAPDGTFATTVVRDDSRFVLLTVPRGYRATHGFFHRVGAEEADSAYFGLTVDPAADQNDFRFIHASDPHVFDATTAAEFGQSLSEAAALTPPADFVVVTGDLVNNGSAQQLAHAASALVAPPIVVHPAFGDHDADPDSLLVRTYENLIGPSYYSFDRGPYHFVIHNDVRSASLDGAFKQLTWLTNDIEAVAPDRSIFVFTHFQPDRAEIDLYKNLGVDAIFSGHWHGNRTQPMEGILSFNSGTFRMGGIDRSSRGFRVVELLGGEVKSQVRTGGIPPRIAVVDPPTGTVPFGSVKIRAMGYGTSESAVEVRYTITGPPGLVAEGTLVQQGGWCYGGTWATAGAEQATYEVTVELRNASGVLASASRSFTLEYVSQPATVPGGPWPSFRGDASGDGRFTTDLIPPLSLVWSRNLGGPTEISSPVVADGRIYLAHGSDGVLENAALVAVDMLSGEEIWRHPTGAEVKGTPAIGDGRVVVLTSNGNVVAFDAMTGEHQWSTALGDSADRRDLTSPTIFDQVVYAGGPAVSAALDLATGAVIWERSLGSDWLATIYSSPAVSGSHVVFGLYSGLHVLDRSTGATIWSRSQDDRETYRSPAIAGGVLYGAGDTFGSQLLRAFDLASGAELWAAPYPLGNSNSAPAVADSLIIIGSGNGSLEAFSRLDGSSVWSLGIGAPIACGRPYARDVATVTSSPLVAGEQVYVGGDDGVLRAVEIADGSVAWSADLGAPIRSSPAASGNVLLISTTDGTLYAFVSGELTTTGAGDPAGAPPVRTAIGIPWPNPFQPAGTIPFDLGGGSGGGSGAGGRAGGAGSAAGVKTRLELFDVTGRKVRTLTDATLPRGHHQVAWDGRDARGQQAASGVYFLRLTVDGRTAATGRLSLVR
jgi:outer membrane protein assembly factor BamB/predicted phosphodiesterase